MWYKEIKPNSDTDSSFFYFVWDPYGGEIYEILIMQGTDSMQIRFRMNMENLEHKDVWNAQFGFDIPFQPGYFEILDFVQEKGKGFTNPKNYSWTIVPPDKRKLM